MKILFYYYQAYLRIRPQPPNHDATQSPYLQVVDDLEVSMTPPEVKKVNKLINDK